MTFPQAVADVLPPDDGLRIGVVLTSTPTTVDIEGTPVPAGALASYVPLVGDTVALLRQDETWLILGRTTSPGTGEFPQAQAGSLSVSFTTLTSHTINITFAIAFRTAPAVSVNINSGVGATAQWHSRAINVTNTGFTIFLFTAGAAVTWTGVDVQWQAQEKTG